MGMQQKLAKAKQEGFEEGQKIANEYAELRGQVKGAMETWDLMEAMFLDIKGIGPKTRDKIMLNIQAYARQEKAKLMRPVKQ